MGRGRPAQYVALTAVEREALETISHKRTASQRDVERAQIALMADRGMATKDIALKLDLSVPTVCRWRGRAARRGKDGLADAPRSGRPARITEEQRLVLIALACEPAEEEGRSTPSLREIADRAERQGILVSRGHLCHILKAGDIHPHRVQQWMHSPDPCFREKVNEICDLYRKPPEGGVVLSIDEKTGIQAIERKYLDRPPRPGRNRRQEFEYIRRGTQALIAAMDVHSGKAMAVCGDRRTQEDLTAFMERVAQAHPTGEVHVIWDNLNTHEEAKWEAFNRRQRGRFRFHYTPLHASWVNQVELLFGVYSRHCLRNASHKSTGELRARTYAFFAERNRCPHPFKWSFRGFQLQTGEPKRKPGRKPLCQALKPNT